MRYLSIVVDLDPEHNPLNRTHSRKMPQAAIDAFKAQGAFLGGDFKSRQDPMHFQFATP
jgi:D-alanyl-D-alanine carboxypeptidase